MSVRALLVCIVSACGLNAAATPALAEPSIKLEAQLAQPVMKTGEGTRTTCASP